MKPYMKRVQGVSKTAKMMFGGGVNTQNTEFTINNNQATYSRNTSSRKSPALASCEGYTSYATALTTPNALGQRNNQYMHVVDGTVWKYWNGSAYVNVQTGLTNAKGEFGEFTKADAVTKYTVFNNGTDKYLWDGTTASSISAMPASKLFTTHAGRLYFAIENVLQYCKLDDPTDWVSTGDDGSGVIAVSEIQGELTAIQEYNGSVITWGEYSMHQLYGTDPTNFEFRNVEGNIGAINNRAVRVANDRLFFFSYNGIYEYNGSQKQKISSNVDEYTDLLNKTYKSLACMGATSKYLYVSFPYGAAQTTNNITLVYDLRSGEWYVQDRAYVNFVTFAGSTYGVTAAGALYLLESGLTWNGTAIEWDFISPAFTAQSIADFVSLISVNLVADLPGDSKLSVSYSNDISGIETQDWTTVTEIESSEYVKNHKIFIPISDSYDNPFFRLRFTGTGECIVHFVEFAYRAHGG